MRNISGSWWRRSECDQHWVLGWVGRPRSRRVMGRSLRSPHAWESWGGDSTGGSRAMREFNEPPNPLILFLACEMGLFPPFRRKETVGNWDFAGEMEGTWVWGGGNRDDHTQVLGAATVGNCPVWFAGWREMPSLPSARRRGPRSGPTSETSTGSPRYGWALGSLGWVGV